jgi:HSP20 family protein
MALFPDPFDALSSLQQALDAFRSSNWLASGPSGGGGYPLINLFRRGDDFVLVTEVPGIRKSDLEIQVKGNTVRVAGRKSVAYPEKASLHRRERLDGRFDRALTLPFEIAADGVKAECRDGILALYLPRAEHERPKTIQVS